MDLTERELRKIVKSYLHNYRLVKYQLDSYNKFANKDLQHIIKEQSPIIISCGEVNRCHVIEFGDVTFKTPMVKENDGYVHSVTPEVARKRSLSYSAPVMLNIHHTVYNHANRWQATQKMKHDYVEVLLFYLPVMVGSELCSSIKRRSVLESNGEDPYDEGGYFITNGNEKAVLAQESICNNYAFVFEDKKTSRCSHVCEIRSLHEDKTRSTSTLTLHITAFRGGLPPNIHVVVPFIGMNIPLPAVFKMLGVTSQEDMKYFILGGSKCHRYDSILHLVNSVLDSEDMNTGLEGEELLEYIGREGTDEKPDKRVGYVQHLINNEMLPHVGIVAKEHRDAETVKRNHMAKAYFLGMAVRKLLLVYSGQLPADDRDNYADKRLATTGVSLAIIFRQKLRKFISTVTAQIRKSIESNKHVDIVNVFHAKRITNGLNYALSTGNWTSKKGNKNQTGVAQILLRMSVPATVSHLRRISSPLNREGKLPKPRQLDPSQWGLLCPSETPEGANCGLIKIMALGMQIRMGHSLIYVTDFLASQYPDLNATPLSAVEVCLTNNIHIEQSMVLVNGVMIGFVKDPHKLVKLLRERRRCLNLAWDTTVLYDRDMDQVIINTDPGACMRPLLVLENVHKFPQLYQEYREYRSGDIRQLWRLLLINGVVEFVDKKEEMTLDVALLSDELEPRHTHMDIHVTLLFGLCTALIPFPEHNQGPRNMYQSCMVKQAISIPCLNYNERMDSVSHVLHYPQKPLVSTIIENMIPAVRTLPTGQNAIVAILCYSGYNVEDSVIVNKSAVDRGLVRCSTYKTFKDSARGQGARINKFEMPDVNCVGRQDAVYDDLDPDGLLAPGIQCGHNHVLIGNTTEMTVMGSNARGTRNNQAETPKRDNSTVYREMDPCVVDTVLVSTNSDGGQYVMTKTRRECIPEIGDKVSSRHGQKGVIGLLMPQEDMPFTVKDGIVPDIIMNPHAFPSRMTIGQMLEQVLGKGCALEGVLGDGTPFQQLKMGEVEERIRKHGLNAEGNEYMINGRTGEMMQEPVFIGPVYFQRLKHMVAYKVHARSTGPVQSTTRQPVEGRSKDGGLRFGEMEAWTLKAHGAAAVLKDRLMDQSDAYQTVYCEACGWLAEPAPPSEYSGQRRQGVGYCRHCQRSDTVHEIQIPHAEKLFSQELGGLMISTRLSKEEHPNFVV